MIRAPAPAAAMFTGASGNTLVGDVYGEEGPAVEFGEYEDRMSTRSPAETSLESIL